MADLKQNLDNSYFIDHNNVQTPVEARKNITGSGHEIKLPGGKWQTFKSFNADPNFEKALAGQISGPNIARQFLGQGIGMFGGDEAVGAARAAYDVIAKDAPFVPSYKKYRDIERAANKAFETRHPVLAPTLQVAGGLATGAAGGGRALAAKGLSTLSKVGRTAGVGGVVGGAGSFGHGEGDFGKQAFQTALGATGGLAMGGLAPGVVALWKAKPVRSLMAKVMPRGASTQARAKVLEAITRDARAAGITKLDDAVAFAQQRLSQMPRGAIAGDTGPNVRGLTAAVGNIPGAGRTAIQQTLVNRQMNRPNRMLEIVGSTTGQKGAPIDTLEGIINHRKTVGGKMYKQAFEEAAENGTTVDVGGLRQRLTSLSSMASKSNRKTYERVSREFSDAGVGDVGAKTSVPRIGLEELHGVKEGIDTIISQVQRSGTSPKVLSEIVDIKTALVERLKGASPKYAKGWETYVDDYAQQRALESGVSIFDRVKALKPDAISSFDKFSGHEKEMFKIGVAAKIEEMVMNGQTTKAIRQMLNTPIMKARLQKVFGKDFDAFNKRIEGEMEMISTETATMVGSRTTPLMKEIEGLTGAVQTGRDVAGAVTGDLGATARLADKLRMVASGPPAKVAEEMAPYLGAKSPEALKQMLRLKRLGSRGGSAGTGVLAGGTVGGVPGAFY